MILSVGEMVSRKCGKSSVYSQRWSNIFQEIHFLFLSRKNGLHLLTPTLFSRCLPLPHHRIVPVTSDLHVDKSNSHFSVLTLLNLTFDEMDSFSFLPDSFSSLAWWDTTLFWLTYNLAWLLHFLFFLCLPQLFLCSHPLTKWSHPLWGLKYHFYGTVFHMYVSNPVFPRSPSGTPDLLIQPPTGHFWCYPSWFKADSAAQNHLKAFLFSQRKSTR